MVHFYYFSCLITSIFLTQTFRPYTQIAMLMTVSLLKIKNIAIYTFPNLEDAWNRLVNHGYRMVCTRPIVNFGFNNVSVFEKAFVWPILKQLVVLSIDGRVLVG